LNLQHFIGNDIVDLNTFDAINYPKNLRFVKRVMCEEEQELLFRPGNPDTVFWLHWAAKEAVYKIVKKIEPHSIFSHQLFHLKRLEINHDTAKGYVRYKEQEYPVTFSLAQDWIHCIANTINYTGKIISIVKPNDEIEFRHWSIRSEELTSVHSKESLLVRCLVKNMLKNVTGKDFEILRPLLLKKFGPPELWLDGQKCRDMDLSMSHDGNYCAGIILLESCEQL
jgi:phosphopantetheinyl transferase (holo-ACP synthase)